MAEIALHRRELAAFDTSGLRDGLHDAKNLHQVVLFWMEQVRSGREEIGRQRGEMERRLSLLEAEERRAGRLIAESRRLVSGLPPEGATWRHLEGPALGEAFLPRKNVEAGLRAFPSVVGNPAVTFIGGAGLSGMALATDEASNVVAPSGP
jgi:hypothetical protein